MTIITLAVVVGVLFATGTYLILQRRAIRLILGLALLTHGVNLLLFSSGGLGRGQPPIIDKDAFTPDGIGQFVDPLPQALILTAIVISFGVTAFTVVLVNRRNALAETIAPESSDLPSSKATDPFASVEHYVSGLDSEIDDIDDYEWLEYALADEYRQQIARRKQAAAEKAESSGQEQGEQNSANEERVQNSEPNADGQHEDGQDEDRGGDV
ncbi:MAG: NADH-quinone oxidoreductase subunit K [Chloroflexota bacterium]